MIAPPKDFSNKSAQKNQYFVQNTYDHPQSISSLNYSDSNSRLRVAVPTQKMADSGRLVVRGNPRICAAKPVELPFRDDESKSKLYMARARTKRRYTKREQLEHRHEKRSTLYKAMATAGKILPSYVNKKGEIRQHGTSLCRRYMQTHENAKGYVLLSVDGNHTAKLTGTITCDNPWVCAVCSSIHLDTRAKEITQVQKNFLAAGRDKHWSTWMLTLTIPHYRDDELDDLLIKKSAVMSDFHAHSAIKKLKARIGWKGYVDSLEVRHSYANGWHPHHHILGFFTNLHPNTRVQCVYDSKRDYYRIATQDDKSKIASEKARLNSSIEKTKKALENAKSGSKREAAAIKKLEKLTTTTVTQLHKIEVQKYIYHIFAYLCVKNGLKRPSEERGVDLRESDDIQDYLTKQSKIAHELTSEHNKKSSYSRSQWEILRDCQSDRPQLAAYSESLFLEFADATKGKAKLHWSPEFKELWLDDEEEENEGKLHDDDDTDDGQNYKITGDIWNRFFTAPDRKNQRQLLEVAEKDSLNNTQNTKLILLVARILLDIEKEKKEKEFSDEQERLFRDWLMMPPAAPPDYISDYDVNYQYS